MNTILVHMSDRQWTMQAVHLACALARNNATSVILLRLIPVTHPSYLGTNYVSTVPSRQEDDDLSEYAATAEDYGVELTLQPMQYVTAMDALVEAAELLDVDMLFAHLSPSRIPYWRQFQKWNLERRLRAAGCRLLTLDESPSVTVEPPAVIARPV